MKSINSFAAAIGVAALALAGCGGSSSTSPISVSNGQAATVAVGQADLTSAGTGSGATGFKNVAGNPFVYGGKLYITDAVGQRIMVYKSIPAASGASADYAIGQPDFATYATTDWTFPGEPAIANGELFVPDQAGGRLVVFNSVPSTFGGTISTTQGGGSNCSSTDISDPSTAVVAGGKLLVADIQNHRVLIWNSIPTTTDAAADRVLGHADFNSTSCKANDGSTVFNGVLNIPVAVWSDGTRIAVLDAGNNRVLIWNSWPTTNGQLADVVLGQSGFLAGTANRGGSAAANTLNTGAAGGGIFFRGDQLFVADAGNHRVLIWNSWPTTNGQAADRVLGQTNFTNTTVPGTPTAASLNLPGGVFATASQVFVSDYGDDRVLIYNGS